MQTIYSTQAALTSAIALGKSVVKECNETKILRGTIPWIVALTAKSVSGGIALRTLVSTGSTLECKLLLRSMLDALIDVLYICQHPRKSEVLDLLNLELQVDRYQHLKFCVETSKMTFEQLFSREPKFRTIVDGYEKAKRHPSFAASRKKGGTAPRRWRNTSARDKLNELPDFDRALKLFGYTIRQLGDAYAHARPESLRDFMYQRRDGSLGIRVAASPRDPIRSSEWVVFEATMCLVVLCDHIIDELYLGKRLKHRVEALVKRMRALSGAQRVTPARGTKRPRLSF